MKDVLGLQPPRFGHDSFTRSAFPHLGSDPIQLRHHAGSRGPMDRAIHAGSAREPGIRRIYDRVGFNERDIAFFEPHHFADG
jgi:hypothetical protein